jgi:hypothetical protein
LHHCFFLPVSAVCFYLQEELGAEGGSEEYARRFCGVVASFGDAHWCQMSGVAQQHLLLRHVSAAELRGGSGLTLLQLY